MNTNLISYVRKNRNPIGVIVATKLANGTVGIGWSKLHKSAGDIFNKALGVEIATKRAVNGSGIPMPFSIAAEVSKMHGRALRYFHVTAEQVKVSDAVSVAFTDGIIS